MRRPRPTAVLLAIHAGAYCCAGTLLVAAHISGFVSWRLALWPVGGAWAASMLAVLALIHWRVSPNMAWRIGLWSWACSIAALTLGAAAGMLTSEGEERPLAALGVLGAGTLGLAAMRMAQRFHDRALLRVDLWERAEVARYATAALGKRGWLLLSMYGRIMGGPNGGLYVSGVPIETRRKYVDALMRGDEIEVHLMHRHRSGHYESSSLRLVDGRLVMRYRDREELA